MPRSDSAFQLVSVIEAIGSVPDNRLSDALLHDLSSGASFVPGDPMQSELVATPPCIEVGRVRRFAIADRAIDWGANLIQKVVRDDVFINADHTHMRHKATVLARVPAVFRPFLSLSNLYSQGSKPLGDKYFYDIQGAELTSQEVCEDGDTTAVIAQLSLTGDVIPDSLHEISCSWDFVSETPPTELAERFFAWNLNFYSCAVLFEGEPPQSIEYVVVPPYEDEEPEPLSITPLTVRDNIVKVTAENFGGVSGYLRYVL